MDSYEPFTGKCIKCLDTGHRHNGYFQYPCDCGGMTFTFESRDNETPIDIMDQIANAHSEEICITDIQLLRGLVMGDYLDSTQNCELGFEGYKRIMGYLNHLGNELLKIK